MSDLAAEWVAPADLKPWPGNPRRNDGTPVAKVVDSIRRFGFGAPIVARLETHEIIAGHTRWKAAKELKLERIPVRFLDITEREAHLLALTDNRLNELTAWDTPLLAAALSEFGLEDAELAGWDGAALEKLTDNIEPLRSELAEDESDALGDIGFAILITCEDEAQQVEWLEKLVGEGLKCRALI